MTRRAWTGREAVLVALVDELHDTSTVSDHTWTALAEHYDEAQLVELVALAGQYHAVSFMANALGVEREDAARAVPRSEGGLAARQLFHGSADEPLGESVADAADRQEARHVEARRKVEPDQGRAGVLHQPGHLELLGTRMRVLHLASA